MMMLHADDTFLKLLLQMRLKLTGTNLQLCYISAYSFSFKLNRVLIARYYTNMFNTYMFEVSEVMSTNRPRVVQSYYKF